MPTILGHWMTAGVALTPLFAASAIAQTPGTAFTYQGDLWFDGAPANGVFDLRFQLWVSEIDWIGPVVCKDNVAVTEGLFTTELDFGPNVIIGFPLWLGIEVRADATPGNCGSPGGPEFMLLEPRQPLTPAPYAVWAATAQTAGLRLPFDGTSTSSVLLHLTHTSNAPSTSTGFFENYSTGNNGRALTAYANGASGETYGLYAQSNSTTGYGVFGRSSGVAGVHGSATATSGVNYGVFGESDSTSGRGVFGSATSASGASYGVYGESESTSGRGVYGLASAASGTTYAVYGQNFSPAGYAGYFAGGRNYFSGNVGIAVSAPRQQLSLGSNLDLYSGNANTPTRPSIRGSNADNLVLNASGTGAVYLNYDGGTGGLRVHDGTGGGEVMRIDDDGDMGIGTTAPSARLHVFGRSGAFAQTVIQGNSTGGCAQFVVQNPANSSNALRGVHFDTTAGGAGVGVYGEGFVGVYGHNPELTGVTYGVQGWAPSRSGRSVYGRAADAPVGYTSYGILGEETALSFGWAIYAIGDVGATGSKVFRIDHPDDPENKYLLHYCPESPEVLNLYSGKVALDAEGSAVVELPHYFAKVNRDPRYLLTAVGAAMPDLHVADEIDEEALAAGAQAGPGVASPRCTFRIAGGHAGGKVCWEVKALRNDLYVRAAGAPVEMDKADLEKGTYQHPELYGEPAEKGLNYQATRAPPARPCVTWTQAKA